MHILWKNNGIMISYFQLHKNMCCHEKNCDFFINLETSDIKLYFGTKINEQNFFLKNDSHVHVCEELPLANHSTYKNKLKFGAKNRVLATG